MINPHLSNLLNYLNYDILPDPSGYYGLLKTYNELYKNKPLYSIPGIHDKLIDQICSNYPGKTWEQLYNEISTIYGVFYSPTNLEEYFEKNPIRHKRKLFIHNSPTKRRKTTDLLLKRHASTIYYTDNIQSKRQRIED